MNGTIVKNLGVGLLVLFMILNFKLFLSFVIIALFIIGYTLLTGIF